MDYDRDALAYRMKIYFDKKIDWDVYKDYHFGLEQKKAGIDPKIVRQNAQIKETYHSERILYYQIRPYDRLFAYYSSVSGVWNRSRPCYWQQCWPGNCFLMSRPAGVSHPEGIPLFFTKMIGDNDALRGHAYYFPFKLKKDQTSYETIQGNLNLSFSNDIIPNYSPATLHYLQSIHVDNRDFGEETASLIWYHALGIGFSPAYLSENADGIRQNWPRIPLPAKKDDLLRSSELGRRVAELLDTETHVSGVTSGVVRTELKGIAAISKIGGGVLNPTGGHLDLTAGWGHAGKDGVCMPGKGKIESVNDVPTHQIGRASCRERV